MSAANFIAGPAGVTGVCTATAFSGAIAAPAVTANILTASAGTEQSGSVILQCSDPDFTSFRFYSVRQSGGGLLQGQMQLFAYSNTVGVSQVLSVDGATAEVSVFNPLSMQNNPLTGCAALSGGDASGLTISNVTGGVAFGSGTRTAAAVDGSAAAFPVTALHSGRVISLSLGAVASTATLPDATSAAVPDGLTYDFVVTADGGGATCSVVAPTAAQLIGRLYVAGDAPVASTPPEVGIEFAVGNAAVGDSVRATLCGSLAQVASRFWLLEARCLNAAGAAWV